MKHQRHQLKNFKTGSASFYTVIITCLLFTVIIISFSYLTIQEQNRNIENDLSQSAYDAALAGVEDAKLALSEYYTCINTGKPLSDNTGPVTTNVAERCEGIKDLVNKSANPTGVTAEEKQSYTCDAVAKILRRNGVSGGTTPKGGEVFLKETTAGTITTTQAYTCVQINTETPDYRGTIGSSTPTRAIPLYQTTDAENLEYVDIYWYSADNANLNGSPHYLDHSGDNITFTPVNNTTPTPIPPVLAVSLYQTDKNFKLDELDNTTSNNTDRGTVWLVPTSESGHNNNTITKEEIASSNNHTTTNTPYNIQCKSSGADYYCTARIYIPKALKGTRSKDTPFLTLSLPYEAPETDFKVVAYTGSGQINFKDAQISIDSTGRANDIFSRVEARVEYRDIFFPFSEYAIDTSGNNNPNSTSLSKNLWATLNCWTVNKGEVTTETCKDDSQAK